MRIQNILPKAIRLKLRILKRILYDQTKGHRKRFAHKNSSFPTTNFSISLKQTIRISSFHENKIANIKLASEKIKKNKYQYR